MHRRLATRRSAALLAVIAPACVLGESIDEIVVTADFRGRSANQLPASVTVFSGDQVEQLAVQHFEELTGVVPNLNWSGDGHRARYFQIRGVGELEQYQGAPNPSVGFLIDDIDFSGIGTVATLFDIEQVEVLRGPQGSRYGANALAGLVYLRSTQPTEERRGRLQLTAGSDDAFSAGLAFGGSLDSSGSALIRLSGHHHQSNGYRDNRFLGRQDTNGRDETIVRGRLALLGHDSADINLSLLYANVDNGYDAFAIDNSYTTLSDKPGRDAQESIGASARIDWRDLNGMQLTSITAVADSAIDFGFDADWGNDDSWSPFIYDFVSLSERSRKTLSQELRLASGDDKARSWLLGLYTLRLEDDLLSVNQGDYVDPFFNFTDSLDENFGSDYEATSVAAFGQFEHALGGNTGLSAGFRLERRAAEYVDTGGLAVGPAETMLGGELALSHDHSDSLSSYVGISKGYKAGGFNLGVVPDDGREFEREELWNIEAGFKSRWLHDTLSVNASLFYNLRSDQQVRTAVQLVPGDPASFVFFTDNAAKGKTMGLEADIRWIPNESWDLFATLGVLEATFDEFLTPLVDLSGRRQAHAPRHTFAAGIHYRHLAGWFARIDISAKGDYYFDVSHDQKSNAYELTNVRLGFAAASWTVQLWARNLFDETYAVRGFFFGNEPPNFPNTLYTRRGDARQLGVTLDKRF